MDNQAKMNFMWAIAVTIILTMFLAVTVPAPVPTTNEYQDAMDYAWSTLTGNERSSICALFNYDPQGAWDAFSESGSDVPQSEFNSFLSRKCSF